MKPVNTEASPTSRWNTAATSVFIGPAVLTGEFTAWSLDPPRPLTALIEHVHRQAQSSTYSHRGKLMAIALADHSICVWDRTRQREALPPLCGHTWEVSSLAFSPDDRLLASASWDGTTRLWNVQTGQSERVFDQAGFFLSFSPDGRTLPVTEFGSVIRLWHLPSAMEMMTLNWSGPLFNGSMCESELRRPLTLTLFPSDGARVFVVRRWA